MKSPLSFETSGELIVLDETQTFASGFSKREFVVKVSDGEYPQDIKFETHKEKADVLDTLRIGQTINVAFNLRGNEYKEKYYTNLVAWKVTSDDALPSKTNESEESGEKDDIPF